MSWDTSYRPRRFSDVLGQESAIQILQAAISAGKGFRKSYLFWGPHGSGKTTLARIVAMSLLCRDFSDGEPCGTCDSCLEILENGQSISYHELDATRQGDAESVRRLVSGLVYESVEQRNIYLYDECFTEDTLLQTREGLCSIRDLVEMSYQGDVLSYEIKSKKAVWKKVTDWFSLGEREVIDLVFDNGVSLTVTPEQEFYTSNRGWVKALNLTENDDVISTLSESP